MIKKTHYRNLKPYIKHNLKGIEIVYGVPKVVFVSWFGPQKNVIPPFSIRRYNAIMSLIEHIKVPVILLTWENYKSFELKDKPMHHGFEYLSGNHKSDYLRSYLLYHYGGGYHDIKFRELSWENEWEKFKDPTIWLIGRREMKPDVIGYVPGEQSIQNHYEQLITMSWVISTSHNKYMETILEKQHSILDSKLKLLQLNPAFEGRQSEQTNPNNENYYYPLRYLELMGEICHPLQLNYLNHIDYSLPDILYKTYK